MGRQTVHRGKMDESDIDSRKVTWHGDWEARAGWDGTVGQKVGDEGKMIQLDGLEVQSKGYAMVEAVRGARAQ